MIWIEHYPESGAAVGWRHLDERFALVCFARADDGRLHSPQWRHITMDGLAERGGASPRSEGGGRMARRRG